MILLLIFSQPPPSSHPSQFFTDSTMPREKSTGFGRKQARTDVPHSVKLNDSYVYEVSRRSAFFGAAALPTGAIHS